MERGIIDIETLVQKDQTAVSAVFACGDGAVGNGCVGGILLEERNYETGERKNAQRTGAYSIYDCRGGICDADDTLRFYWALQASPWVENAVSVSSYAASG